MAIIFDKAKKIFYLHTNNTSYILGLMDSYLVHAYWGKRIDEIPSLEYAAPTIRYGFSAYNESGLSSECLPMEYPVYGNTDLRSPAFHAIYEDGSSITDFRYVSHKIIDGKPRLSGLPSTYSEDGDAETLEITLHDEKTGADFVLVYSVFSEKDAVTRSVRVENHGDSVINISRILSASVDFHGMDFEMISLWGKWARERQIQRTPLFHGGMTVDSKRGASGHQMNPMIALVRRNTTEESGEAYGMNFVYSGNFLAGAEVSNNNLTRMFMGLNPFDFNWRLEPGEDFTAPEVVMVYSDCGIGGMSRIYHNLYRNHLCRGKYKLAERPVLINNWEATYFDFNEEKILNIAKKAKEIGVELMVLDDGWFGERNNDDCSLGDWFVNFKKLPDGISGLSEKIEQMGMKFGLWFEPEMVSPISQLYKAHPDWCLHVPGRHRSEHRNQLTLDYSNPEVCDYILEVMTKLLSESKISYIKWDMNRHMTEIGSAALPAERQRETAHRYILGLYRVLETLTERFPDILFESCSGGGGRFDAGMLYYMPQVWTSDDSDAVERLYIQYGTSIAYPAITMGAHVSAVPNHQVGRTTSMQMRADVAMMGQFGFELDLNKLSPEELETAKNAIEQFKRYRKTIQFGNMYRLRSPFEGECAVFEFVSEDGEEVLFCAYSLMNHAENPYEYIRLMGLCEDASYQNCETGELVSGKTLANIGVQYRNEADFSSRVIAFRKVK